MKSKKIAVFGCSWSQGLYTHKFDNWVTQLSYLYPEHTFYNFALGGTSTSFHTYLLEEARKFINIDISIFQHTSPGRFTWWEPFSLDTSLVKKTDNLYVLDENRSNYVKRINPGTISSRVFRKSDPKTQKFGDAYYERLNHEQIALDAKVYANYVTHLTDLQIQHVNYLEDNTPTVYTALGEKQFKRYIIDDGKHFGPKGNVWQATWVNDLLKERGLM